MKGDEKLTLSSSSRSKAAVLGSVARVWAFDTMPKAMSTSDHSSATPASNPKFPSNTAFAAICPEGQASLHLITILGLFRVLTVQALLPVKRFPIKLSNIVDEVCYTVQPTSRNTARDYSEQYSPNLDLFHPSSTPGSFFTRTPGVPKAILPLGVLGPANPFDIEPEAIGVEGVEVGVAQLGVFRLSVFIPLLRWTPGQVVGDPRQIPWGDA